MPFMAIKTPGEPPFRFPGGGVAGVPVAAENFTAGGFPHLSSFVRHRFPVCRALARKSAADRNAAEPFPRFLFWKHCACGPRKPHSDLGSSSPAAARPVRCKGQPPPSTLVGCTKTNVAGSVLRRCASSSDKVSSQEPRFIAVPFYPLRISSRPFSPAGFSSCVCLVNFQPTPQWSFGTLARSPEPPRLRIRRGRSRWLVGCHAPEI